MDEKLIEKHMKTLGISREEAIELIETDKRIDRGEKLFDLDPELEKGAKKARQADRKPNSTPIKRERKANPTKADIVRAMIGGLLNDPTSCPDPDSLEVTNPEREFLFTLNGTKYKVTLACPRK